MCDSTDFGILDLGNFKDMLRIQCPIKTLGGNILVYHLC